MCEIRVNILQLSMIVSQVHCLYVCIQVDILDGNVTRDNTYGVLVIQSPNSPAADKSFLQEEPNNDTQNRSTVGTATRHQEQRVRAQGTAYKQHYNIWDSIKRESAKTPSLF